MNLLHGLVTAASRTISTRLIKIRMGIAELFSVRRRNECPTFMARRSSINYSRAQVIAAVEGKKETLTRATMQSCQLLLAVTRMKI